MRIGYRVVLACLLVLASLGGAALDCKVWLPLLPQDFDDMLGDEALVYQAGLSKPKAACVARREYISPKSLRKATIMILQARIPSLGITMILKDFSSSGRSPTSLGSRYPDTRSCCICGSKANRTRPGTTWYFRPKRDSSSDWTSNPPANSPP